VHNPTHGLSNSSEIQTRLPTGSISQAKSVADLVARMQADGRADQAKHLDVHMKLNREILEDELDTVLARITKPPVLAAACVLAALALIAWIARLRA
jgi:hypothetical protein